MRFARREAEDPSIDLTSLIDVVFLLLIFFMVTTRFIDGANLSLQLPSVSQAKQDARRSPVVVAVDGQNRLYIAGERVKRGQLAATLRARHEQQPKRALVLRADRRANHGAVVRVLDIAASQGFDSVDIAVLKRGG